MHSGQSCGHFIIAFNNNFILLVIHAEDVLPEFAHSYCHNYVIIIIIIIIIALDTLIPESYKLKLKTAGEVTCPDHIQNSLAKERS